jgi:hypothetical protein
MRWRGLSPSRTTPVYRSTTLAYCRAAVALPGQLPTRGPARSAGFPAPPTSPRSPPEPGTRFGSRAVLRPPSRPHKGFRSPVSRFFGHPQFIHRTRPVLPRQAPLSTGSSTAGSTAQQLRDQHQAAAEAAPGEPRVRIGDPQRTSWPGRPVAGRKPSGLTASAPPGDGICGGARNPGPGSPGTTSGARPQQHPASQLTAAAGRRPAAVSSAAREPGSMDRRAGRVPRTGPR